MNLIYQKRQHAMNDRIFAPALGFMLSWISFETLQNFFASILIAFLGGIAAWAGKKAAMQIEKWWRVVRSAKTKQ